MMKCPHCGQSMPEPPNAVQVIAAEFPGLPIEEMIDRQWLPEERENPDALRGALMRFFDADDLDELRARLYGAKAVTP